MENEDFIKDYQEASNFGVTVKKPVYEEDEQENRDKIDEGISKANDKLRKAEIKDAVEAKLEEKGQTTEELSVDKLKTYTDRIEQETDAEVAKVESKEALARENQEKFHNIKKPSNYQKEYNKAHAKILKGRKEADKDKEIMDKIEDKPFKKEHAKKEKKIDKKVAKMEKKELKKEMKEQVKKDEKVKEEKIEEDEKEIKEKGKEEEDSGKTEVEKEIESAVTKAENDGKIPSE